MKNICIFGDSLVYGMEDLIEGGWVTRLEKKINYNKFKFWNFGIPGDTSQDLLSRIEEETKKINPDLAIVFIGANDSSYLKSTKKNMISLKNYKENLFQIFSVLKKYTDKIYFMGLPRMDDSITTNWNFKYHFSNSNLSKYDKIIKNFCKENKIKYISIENILTNEMLSDGAHPNPKGYQNIMLHIYKKIDFKSILGKT